MNDHRDGEMLRAVELRNFWQTLSVKTDGGLKNLAQTLESAAHGDLFDCGSLKPIIQQMAQQIRNGSYLSQAMHQSGIFSPQEVCWITTGEDRGALEAFIDDLVHQRPVEDREAQLFTFWRYLGRSLQFNGRIEDIFKSLKMLLGNDPTFAHVINSIEHNIHNGNCLFHGLETNKHALMIFSPYEINCLQLAEARGTVDALTQLALEFMHRMEDYE